MLQAGDGVRLKGFIAGPFDVKAEQSAHQVDLYLAPLKDSMLSCYWEWISCEPQSQTGPGCRDPLLGGRDYMYDLGPEPGPPGGSSDSD